MVNDPNESKRPSMSGSVYPVSPALSEFMALGLKGLPSGSRSGWGVEERKPQRLFGTQCRYEEV